MQDSLDRKIFLPDVVGKGYASFWNTRKRYRVAKGGKGSKKSTTEALWIVYFMMKPEFILANTLVVRKVADSNKDSTFAQLKWATYALGVSHLWKFTVSPLEATYIPTGQKILFRGFDNPLKLASITVPVGYLCWVWMEEIYEIEDFTQFDMLDKSIRGKMPPGYFAQLTLTFNPWVNTHWSKEKFFDKVNPRAFTLTTTHHCNEFLSEEDHENIELLAITDPERYKVIGLGEYGIPGGAYFAEFRKSIHVREDFKIPDHWNRYFAFDYGLDMLAAYLIAVDTNGRAFVYRELYQSNLLASDAATRILEFIGKDKIYQKYAPPDLIDSRNKETGRTVIDIFRENKLSGFLRADNNLDNGCVDMKEWLKPVSDEQGNITANLVIFESCVNLIRTISQIAKDKHRPNIYAKDPHELTHAPDAIRYFVSGRPKPTAGQQKQLPEWQKKRLEQLYKENNSFMTS